VEVLHLVFIPVYAYLEGGSESFGALGLIPVPFDCGNTNPRSATTCAVSFPSPSGVAPMLSCWLLLGVPASCLQPWHGSGPEGSSHSGNIVCRGVAGGVAYYL